MHLKQYLATKYGSGYSQQFFGFSPFFRSNFVHGHQEVDAEELVLFVLKFEEDSSVTRSIIIDYNLKEHIIKLLRSSDTKGNDVVDHSMHLFYPFQKIDFSN